MKKILFSIGLALAGVIGAVAQTNVFTPQVVTVTNIAPVTFTGTNAQIVAAQLLSLTNGAGQQIVPASIVTNRATLNVLIRVVNSNGVPVSITAVVR